jgi:hypothetical protein
MRDFMRPSLPCRARARAGRAPLSLAQRVVMPVDRALVGASRAGA